MESRQAAPIDRKEIPGLMNPMTSLTVRKCDSLEEFQACVDLQREIWGEADLDVEPSTTFIIAVETGGQVLGAFDNRRLVGYTLALVGLRNGAPYLHSHMTGVAAGYRDRGVGRSLKMFQREEALGRGIRLIEWTFDPLELRNAHFNLNRLGAICRRYLPNLYGITSSPLHRGLATDRLVAEWYLDSPRVLAAIARETNDPLEAPATIHLPAELEQWKANDPTRVQGTQARLRTEFSNWFGKGYAALAVRTLPADPAYLLAPWSDF
ncbi:MAG TPA: GNAT family N-acetyltransferase [Candidatus Acidoferrum sp.]|nr:GNAT family N-acetyltransferase [Candidatus Acidoferrum sp.]